jgi:hypothetical protein
MAMVSMAGHVFVAMWHTARQATGLANTAWDINETMGYIITPKAVQNLKIG